MGELRLTVSEMVPHQFPTRFVFLVHPAQYFLSDSNTLETNLYSGT